MDPSWVDGTVSEASAVTQTPGLRWYWTSEPTVLISAEKYPLAPFEAIERVVAREVRHKSLGTLPKLIFITKFKIF
jgi:hypothetical protein